MMDRRMTVLSLSSATVLLSLIAAPVSAQEAAAPQPAAAQTTGAAPTPGARTIEEVIVTARRKEENLQEVPVSVTAIGGEALAERGIRNILDLQASVPSLRISGSDINPKAFLVGIRGLRSGTYAATEDPTAGTYFAEVVQAHPYGFGSTMFDLSSVQVLKGPQGTLFGRNHTAGAILIEPNRASIEEGFHGSVKLRAGNYEMKGVEGVLNVPLNDVAAVRFAYRNERRSGYTTNILTGQDFDGVDEQVARLSFLIKPSAEFTSHTIFDYLIDSASPTATQNESVFLPQISGANLAVYGPNVAMQKKLGPRRIAVPFGTGLGGPTVAVAPNDIMAPKFCVTFPNSFCRENLIPTQTVESTGFVNNTSYDFGSFTVKNIIGYRKTEHLLETSAVVAATSTGVGNPVIGFTGVQDNRQEQFSEELQFTGKAFDDRLDWIAGAFWFKERYMEDAPSFGFTTTAWNRTASHGWNKAQALFAQGTYKWTDQWSTTVGLRRNWDERYNRNTSRNGFNVNTGVPSNCQFRDLDNNPLPNDDCFLAGTAKWNATTWNLSAEYKMTPDVMFYIASRRGYKSGGFARNSPYLEFNVYNPEFVQDIEIGTKSEFYLGEMPARLNLAVYRSKVSDLQINVGQPVPGTNPVIFISLTNNAGKAQVEGVELEATLAPTENLDLSGFLGYTKAEYKKYVNPTGGPGNTPVDISDTPFSSNGRTVPKWQSGISAQYRIHLAELGTLKLNGEVTYRSEAGEGNEKYFAKYGSAFRLNLEEASRTLVNLRADWDRFLGQPFTLSLFVHNATDKTYKDGGTCAVGICSAHYAPPRMYGMELTYRFGEGFRPED